MNNLIDPSGHRLYLTAGERAAFLAAAAKAPRDTRTFCEVLHYTGCRISEALALTARRVDLDNQVLVFETLKKRRTGVFREVPVPAARESMSDPNNARRSCSGARWRPAPQGSPPSAARRWRSSPPTTSAPIPS